jgi:diguanylate cyclase (GGDEF)-like protein/PAS domain S-box-containing protein
MFARHHNEDPRLDCLIEPPARRSGFAAPIVVSVVVLIAVVAFGTNTRLFAWPLLALLVTAAVAAVLVSLRRADDGSSPGTGSAFRSEDSTDSGAPGESLFAASPIPSLLLDAEFHEIMAANAAAADLYGYPLVDLRGQRMAKLQCAPAADSDGSATHPVSGLARHRRMDGTSLWVELGVRPIVQHGREAWLIGVVDVTARMQLQRELEDGERQCRELIELSLGIVFTHDLGGDLRMVNPAFVRALGVPAKDLIGQNLSRFVVPRQHEAFNDYLCAIGRDGRNSGAVHMLRHDGGELVWEFRNQLRTLADGSREVLCCAIDISERSRNERRLLERSRKDPLTGCYNRRHLDVFQADAEPEAQWACVVVDIDHLKRYNDTHGHRAGDQALVRLAHFLDRIVRKDDSVVRLGGDEFVILLRQCDQTTLESFATRLQAALATQETIPFSFGLAMRKKNEDLEQTIHRADRQMIERRFIERSSIRLDGPREARRPEMRRPVIRIHPERESPVPFPVPFAANESER